MPQRLPGIGVGLVVLLLLPTAVPAQFESAPQDLFGRPLPWGPTVDGARLSIRLPRARMLFGQPLEALLVSKDSGGEGPFVRLRVRAPQPTTRLQLLTADGQEIPFTVSLRAESSGAGGSSAVVRLQAHGRAVSGRHLLPGVYRLRATLEAVPDRADPLAWVGRLRSNTFVFEILPDDPKTRELLLPEDLRKKAQRWVRELDHRSFRIRQAAEQGLAESALDVLPILEGALESDSLEVQLRTRRVVSEQVLAPLSAPAGRRGLGGMFDVERWHNLVFLTDSSWRLLEQEMGGEAPGWRMETIARSGVLSFGDLRTPSPAQVRTVISHLEHAEAAVRLRTVRGLSLTQNEQILSALVARLKDPYRYWGQSFGDPVPVRLLAREAGEAIVWQGKAALPALLEFGRESSHLSLRADVVTLVGEIGPDANSLKFLTETLQGEDFSSRYATLQVLPLFGEEAIPLLLTIAADERVDYRLRREATTDLGQAKRHEKTSQLLTKLLEDPIQEVVAAAATSIHALRLTEALPSLWRLARNEKMDQNARHAALHAIVALDDPGRAESLLLELLDTRVHSAVRGAAMKLLAQAGCQRALPRMLNSLADMDWFVRASADSALRALSGQATGVGYDPNRPEPTRWIDYWKNKK